RPAPPLEIAIDGRHRHLVRALAHARPAPDARAAAGGDDRGPHALEHLVPALGARHVRCVDAAVLDVELHAVGHAAAGVGGVLQDTRVHREVVHRAGGAGAGVGDAHPELAYLPT